MFFDVKYEKYEMFLMLLISKLFKLFIWFSNDNILLEFKIWILINGLYLVVIYYLERM